MNKQTKAYRKLGLSTKVVKGSGYAEVKSFEKFEGRECITAFDCKDKNKQNKRTSPWRGAGKGTNSK